MSPPLDHAAFAAAIAADANAPEAVQPSFPPALLARARQARQLRARMSHFLPRDLLVDPAWDMMIDLFVAAGTGERLYVKDLTLMSGESTTSAMRRIDRLQEAGLLSRHADPADHRRVRVRLTGKGYQAMAAMLDHLFDPPSGAQAAAEPQDFAPGPVRG
ncbi:MULTISPECIES: MarR family winged helix-turn-helix transcriptional regulator [Sphingomonas]|uniref:MarR family winged helix-turn-helix transcriptional regulator n=1 Tax=Sphingomonas kyungheensis TaxID=1069987 RepID=A0ABU8GYT3_9SPHN|nr:MULTISPECIES: MarR family winged helix-turn-helix transcriptional regulator [unclassified Sphingomonas]EZP52936.1 MarR family protein [Sphingomonas sp. RIT328]